MEEKNRKKVFITGITGQDGSYLAELLLSKNYEVHGLVRRSSTFNRGRIEHLYSDALHNGRFFLYYGDLADGGNLRRLIVKIKPDEIYNLGAQSHVGVSFEMPEYTFNVVALGALKILEVLRDESMKTKFYQASSSEMFGNAEPPQNEMSRFEPASPYGSAKLAAFNFTKDYREAYGIYAVNGILFNHESPRRGENFVTRKITIGVSEILAGKRDKISLGNLEARRDWGYAPEYVEAMWRMMQAEKPDDYVVATGETHSIKEFLKEAFMLVGIKNWEKYIAIDERHYRPNEVHHLIGNISKAKKVLGWEPKTKFKELVRVMLAADCKKFGIELKK